MSSNGFGISEVIDALQKKNYHKISNANDFDNDFAYRHYGRHYYFWSGDPIFGRPLRRNIDSALQNINKELSAAVKPISSVSVKIDETTGRRFVLFTTNNNINFYPDEVSDGTIKWLCILTSIYVGFSNIYLLEEPENFCTLGCNRN